MQFVSQNLGWILAVIILVIGLLVGFGDLLRISVKRIWAISGICSKESVRRRILWITPVAILGIIVVSQLQNPLDEQDAIRQTVKICLFTTGLVVVVSTIILACTNLPREIENRVIYTVVTKPTTRLEIVLGKVVGFARVSFVILVIMGVFTFGYLTVRAWGMQRFIGERIETPGIAESTRQTLKHYQETGLLTARTLETAKDLQMYSRLPDINDKQWTMVGGGEGSMLVPFAIPKADLVPPGVSGATPGSSGAIVVLNIGYRQRANSKSAKDVKPTVQTPATQASSQPATPPYYGPYIMPPEEREAILAGVQPQSNPVVSIDIMDRFQSSLGQATNPLTNQPLELTNKNGLSRVVAQVPPNVAGLMGGAPIYVRVTGGMRDFEYYVEENPVTIKVQASAELIMAELQRLGVPPQEAGGLAGLIAAANMNMEAKDRLKQVQEQLAAGKAPEQQELARVISSFAVREINPTKPVPTFVGRTGSFGQQLPGEEKGTGPVGVYQFRGADVRTSSGQATFEGRFGIERSGNEMSSDYSQDQPTELSVRVRSLPGGKISEPVIVKPESNRSAFFTVPAEAVAGGDFDLIMQTLTPGHYVGLQGTSVSLIASRQPFFWNLAKSLLILWLMSVLVTAVAIFTSTFLSWPIAVVLTLLILLGHWGVEQLGDATQPGIGNQIVTDLGLRESAPAKAVSATVEQLSWFLNFASTVLPDISRFTAVEDIERGVTVSAKRLGDAAAVALGFGIPLTVLAYVVLKNKEVAP